jgi:hypothetical protein
LLAIVIVDLLPGSSNHGVPLRRRLLRLPPPEWCSLPSSSLDHIVSLVLIIIDLLLEFYVTLRALFRISRAQPLVWSPGGATATTTTAAAAAAGSKAPTSRTRGWYEPCGVSDARHGNKPTGRCSDGIVQSDFVGT